MTLWNIIRDWFVNHIWGGYTSDLEQVSGFLGYDLIEQTDFYTDDSFVNLGLINGNGDSIRVTLGDWLSTTSTIIVLILLCAFLIMCVIWLFKFFGGLFKW